MLATCSVGLSITRPDGVGVVTLGVLASLEALLARSGNRIDLALMAGGLTPRACLIDEIAG